MPDTPIPDNQDRLYNLLPVYYRQRDFDAGEPLRALLRVVSEQVNVVERDISRLYENWFIETCEDWVVPYIADLIGYHLPPRAGVPGDVATAEGRLRNRMLTSRSEIANTIRYRRRKGTLALLESLARDVAGWPARAVEFGRLLGATQPLNHLRRERGRLVSLRDGDALDLLGTPFDRLAHFVDVRRINSLHSRGRYGASSVGLFVFRLKTYAVTRSEACCMEADEGAGDNCFTFSPLGNDTPLFHRGAADVEPKRFSGEPNLPVRIRRRTFEEIVSGQKYGIASAALYGEGKSVAIWAGKDAKSPIPRHAIIPADLSGWFYTPPSRYVAVDPERGRICFHPGETPYDVLVSYSYGFNADIGGGEYQRPEFATGGDRLYSVGSDGGEVHNRVRQAVDQWKQDRPRRAVIEIADSQIYDEPRLQIDLQEGQFLEIRAIQGARPVIRVADSESGHAESISIGGAGGVCVFDGVLITGRGVRVQGGVVEVVFRHCTLVPGWGLHNDCKPRHAADPSILLRDTCARLTIEHSIAGGIEVDQPRRETEPIRIRISDSILDATSAGSNALWAHGYLAAWTTLTILRCTVIGRIETHAIELAENCIFMGKVTVARRQRGCVRFCYVPPDSLTPHRYNCQPDLVARGLIGSDQAALQSSVIPVLNSTRYGTPDYCQLSENCPEEIRRGADDESEMGVFHDLFEPQRRAGLQARLEEFVPAGSQVGILFAS